MTIAESSQQQVMNTETQVWIGAASFVALCGVNLARKALSRVPLANLQHDSSTEKLPNKRKSRSNTPPPLSKRTSTDKIPRKSKGSSEETGSLFKENQRGEEAENLIGSAADTKRASSGRDNKKSHVDIDRSVEVQEGSTSLRRPRKTATHEPNPDVCPLLKTDVSGFTYEEHCAALTTLKSVTVKTLRDALAETEAAPSSAAKDILVDLYVRRFHKMPPKDSSKVSSTSSKRASSTRASDASVKRARKVPAPDADNDADSPVPSPRKSASAASKKPAPAASSKQTATCCVGPGSVISMDRMKFQISKHMAPGADSTIFSGKCIEGKQAGADVAIKVQPRSRKTVYQVTTEYTTMRALHAKPIPGLHIQTPLSYGCHNDEAYVLVTELLGDNVLALVPKSGLMEPKMVLLLALQGIPLLEALHKCNYIHRDIKPDNFVMKTHDGTDQLYLIDFGTAESLLDRNGSRRTQPQVAEGTPAYMAISTHDKQPLSPRDDLESFGWMLLRLLVGKVPWETYTNIKQFPQIAAAKRKMIADKFNIEGLGDSMRTFFQLYFGYIQKLKADCGAEHSKALLEVVKKVWTANKKEYGAMPAPNKISFRK